MLDLLQRGFNTIRNKIRGVEELTEAVVDDVLVDVRRSLLEADVALPVVKEFLSRVKQKAVGETVQTRAGQGDQKVKISAEDAFIGICNDELAELLGPVDTSLRFRSSGPSIVMLVGLQGSGKTTTAGKMARFLEKSGKKPMLVAADVYRPAAVEQLKVLGEQLSIPVYHRDGHKPVQLCKDALAEASRLQRDVLILDTAGRLVIDEPLMLELESIKKETRPDNILLVCDAMIGQDAVNMSKEFNRRLNVDGFIMTKLDGDTRGGSMLSVKEVTGRPIKFVGMGESLDRLEEFRPESMTSRILGFGDIVGLVKDFQDVADEEKMEEDALRMLQGGFTLSDFVSQIQMLRKMGPLNEVMEKLPGMSQLMANGATFDDRYFVRIESMINSMTPDERIKPHTINQSRTARIARGSGNKPHDIRNMLAQYQTMKKMFARLGQQTGLLSKIPGMKQVDQMMQMKKMMKDMDGDESALSGFMEGLKNPFRMGYKPEFSTKALSEEELRRAKNKRKADRKKGRR